MMLGLPLDLKPMEALPVTELPSGARWLFEPKYDGFRCLVFRDGNTIHLQSRRQRPLGRYFPEILQAAKALRVEQFVLDGELIIPDESFDVLQSRLHPAASRISLLSREHPAQFIAFDSLTDEQGHSLLSEPFHIRRAALEAFFEHIHGSSTFLMSKTTKSAATARGWLKHLGRGVDGIVAKRVDLAYQSGRRAMQKFKLWQTVDCVVGGLYYKPETRSVEYLLMGLYDAAGRLNYVGRCGVADNAGAIGKVLEPLLGGGGFTGVVPGGRSRWSGREREPVPLQPRLVAEVSADYIENGRFRHGSRFIRWRTDKEPTACTMDQLMSDSTAPE